MKLTILALCSFGGGMLWAGQWFGWVALVAAFLVALVGLIDLRKNEPLNGPLMWRHRSLWYEADLKTQAGLIRRGLRK